METEVANLCNIQVVEISDDDLEEETVCQTLDPISNIDSMEDPLCCNYEQNDSGVIKEIDLTQEEPQNTKKEEWGSQNAPSTAAPASIMKRTNESSEELKGMRAGFQELCDTVTRFQCIIDHSVGRLDDTNVRQENQISYLTNQLKNHKKMIDALVNEVGREKFTEHNRGLHDVKSYPDVCGRPTDYRHRNNPETVRFGRGGQEGQNRFLQGKVQEGSRYGNVQDQEGHRFVQDPESSRYGHQVETERYSNDGQYQAHRGNGYHRRGTVRGRGR